MTQSVIVEVYRDRTPGGEALSSIGTHNAVPQRAGQTLPDAVEQFIRPFAPSRTCKSGVYSFESSEHGTGHIRVDLQNWAYQERMDDKVQLMEVERELGEEQPARLADAPLWHYGFRLHVRNPYFQVLFGLLFISAGIAPFAIPTPNVGIFTNTVFSVLGVFLIAAGAYYWAFRGLRRMRWWHRARAAVRRSGDKMPEDLRVFK